MVKHTQTTCLSVFDHFVKLLLKWLSLNIFGGQNSRVNKSRLQKGFTEKVNTFIGDF